MRAIAAEKGIKNPVHAEAGESLIKEAWMRFRRNKLAMTGLFMTLSIIFAAIFAGALAPYDPKAQLAFTVDPALKLAAPSMQHPMGNDLYGRDILSRVLHGARISLEIGIFATLVTIMIGVPLGR
jgi:peptide/nickel transport system permease protein/oligopeptide transport system permease protein